MKRRMTIVAVLALLAGIVLGIGGDRLIDLSEPAAPPGERTR